MAPTHFRAARPRGRLAVTSALGALALVVSSCGSSGSERSDTATPKRYDDAPLTAAAAWLGDQATEGVVHNDQYDIDDYGLTIDVALALDAVRSEPSTVRTIGDRLAQHVHDVVSPGFGTVTSAGGTAKAAVLAETIGEDPSSFGGTDLIQSLEGTVAAGGPSRGRVQDQIDPQEKSAADYANVVAQSYAVVALSGVDSDLVDAATDFLLAQQCEGGWFRLSFTADPGAADQSCDGDRASEPDIDATAIVVRALSSRTDDAAVAESVDSAVAWLENIQAEDGSFGGGSATTTPNSNSTGLAGWALGDVGKTAAAEDAAVWLVQRQTVEGAACGHVAQADLGAIAYDENGLATADRRGITVKARDQFLRASAQAVPALQWLPTGAADPRDQTPGTC